MHRITNSHLITKNEIRHRRNKKGRNQQRMSSRTIETNDSCVVGGTFAYVLMLSSIFGMAPLRYRSHEKGYRISVSKPMCIYSHVLVFSLGLSALFGKIIQMIQGKNFLTESAKLTQLIVLYFNFTIAMLAFMGVMGGYKRMKNLIVHLKKIAVVDISLGTQYSRHEDIKMFTTAVLMFILLNALLLYGFVNRSSERFNFIVHTFMDAVMCIKMNMYLQFVYIFITVRNRFKSINDALTLITCQWSEEFTHVPRAVNVCVIHEDDTIEDTAIIARKSVSDNPQLVVSPNDAIQRITILRGNLCDIINSMNKDCGLPILITILSTTWNLVAPLYFGIFVLSIPDAVKKAIGLTINCLWITLHTSVMIFLIDPCHSIVQEDKKTRSILCRLMRLAPSSSILLSLLDMFGHQVMLKPALFQPLYMCTLNRPLAVTILGAVATYLVIFLEFGR